MLEFKPHWHKLRIQNPDYVSENKIDGVVRNHCVLLTFKRLLVMSGKFDHTFVIYMGTKEVQMHQASGYKRNFIATYYKQGN